MIQIPPFYGTMALSDFSSDWLFSMDKDMINSVVFLDIRKAFDTVDHKILLDKLSGIEEDQLSFFKSYLNDRTQCCSINGVKSLSLDQSRMVFLRDQY